MPAREALAALDHRPERERLKTINVSQSGGVRFICPRRTE